jgi:phosphatidylserine decarboxylase
MRSSRVLELIERSAFRILATLIAISIVIALFYYPLSIPFILFSIFTAYFFRDPKREIGIGVVSPADGKIDYIDNRRMEIFMSPFDCHVNRSPVKGKVVGLIFREGKLSPAYKRESNVKMNEIIIEAEDGIYRVIQIAGIFARRILCFVKEGQNIEKGQKIGMIIFGSRVVLELPKGYRFVKKIGDKVRAGETVAVRNEDFQGS